MSVKEAIKAELLSRIKAEMICATARQSLNLSSGADNFDCGSEIRFLQKLKEFAESI